MKKMIIFSLLALGIQHNTNAQFYKSVLPSPAFTESLGQVARDFRNNFYQIQGAQLPSQEDMDVYKSLVTIPGATHCVIYRFHSKEDTTASWQGILYSGENYNEAVKAYKNTCRQISKSRIKTSDNSLSGFSGKMDEPDANVRFVSSSFKLNSKDPAYDKFYADVELVNLSFDQWEVHLNLQYKRDDDGND